VCSFTKSAKCGPSATTPSTQKAFPGSTPMHELATMFHHNLHRIAHEPPRPSVCRCTSLAKHGPSATAPWAPMSFPAPHQSMKKLPQSDITTPHVYLQDVASGDEAASPSGEQVPPYLHRPYSPLCHDTRARITNTTFPAHNTHPCAGVPDKFNVCRCASCAKHGPSATAPSAPIRFPAHIRASHTGVLPQRNNCSCRRHLQGSGCAGSLASPSLAPVPLHLLRQYGSLRHVRASLVNTHLQTTTHNTRHTHTQAAVCVSSQACPSVVPVPRHLPHRCGSLQHIEASIFTTLYKPQHSSRRVYLLVSARVGSPA